MVDSEVVELIRESNQGRTSPWICRLSDGNIYYIKGVKALHRGLIYEYLCAELGRSLGLPIPSSTIAYLDSDLLRYNIAAKNNFGAEDCYVFASKEMKNLAELKYSDLPKVNSQIAKLLFFFDHLIQNEDRTLSEKGGNPNLFMNQINSELAVFDHNLAFDKNYDFESNKNLHSCTSFWFNAQRELNFKDDMLYKLPIAIEHLAKYAEGVPDEWLESCDDLLEDIFAKLNLYKTEEFWEELQ